MNLVETRTGEEAKDYEDEETGNDDPGYEATKAFADEGVLFVTVFGDPRSTFSPRTRRPSLETQDF